MGKPAAAGDVRAWDEEAYRNSVLLERERRAKTVFKTAFAPSSSANPGPEVIVVASSDGSVSPYSISSCVASAASASPCILLAQPLHTNQGHIGPAYDVKFYGDGEDALLLSYNFGY
ncbi:hypothetical protein Taro_001504 [Colocasia esculenta]|uniref:Uncharacterized protein n=1 Tax=Colocasia esculenta TaxID=4460 RepID=A0A843TJ72_COLES|nr:hypothetical protein [Colocasia esculenta]